MIIELQKKIVQEIAMNTPSGWDRITVNMEIDNVDGDLVSSESSEVWIGDQAEELDLSYEASEYFEELRSEMLIHDKENDSWTICDLEIHNDGSYKFRFSYDEPPRLSTLKG